MKKLFGSAALTLALAASLVPAALADDIPANVTIAARPEAPTIAARPYANTLILNGDKLDTSAIPFMEDTALVPMRLIAESDFGSADWWQEDNMGVFYLGKSLMQVSFTTGEVTLDDEVVSKSGVAYNGVTYVPADVLAKVDGYEVEVKTSEGSVEITTPNNDPLIKGGYTVSKAANSDMGMRASAQEMKDYYSIPVDEFDSIFSIFPMMTTPDTIVMGKLKKDADVKAVKDALEAYRAGQEETFTWYLSGNLPKVQNAKVVVEDNWFLFLIAEDADAGVEAFKTFVAEQSK